MIHTTRAVGVKTDLRYWDKQELHTYNVAMETLVPWFIKDKKRYSGNYESV